MKILNLYAGQPRQFGPRGKLSAIHKSPVESAKVNKLGMEDDSQADKRFHGGPEKALHQYSLAGYEKIMKFHPIFHKRIFPGCLGENITSDKLSDDTVCIGDIYQLGSVKVQVSSPRIPCWKISHKLDMSELDKFIGQNGITGWYYRVLEEGVLNVGDPVTLVERMNEYLTIRNFMKIVNHQNNNVEDVKAAGQAKGLDPLWQTRLEHRVQILTNKGHSESDYTV